MPHQRSSRHLLPILPALYPSLLPLPVRGYLSRHPLPVRRLQLGSLRLAWASDHADCLPNISMYAHPIEQGGKGTKLTLETSWVRRCNHAIVRVEGFILMPTLMSTLAPLFRSLHHHIQPVLHHRIHNHIECGWGERISLRHSSVPLKRRPVIAARPCHHSQPPPICLENPTGSGSHAVTFQDLKAPGPVQCITRLVQVQEYHVQDLPPQGC